MNLEKLRRQLIEHEGVRLKAYHCTAGYLTIGVGRNLDAKGITMPEAMALLDGDIEEVLRGMRRVPAFNSLEGDDVRRRVLVDMAFNLGIDGLLGFRRTLQAIEDGNYTYAADLMLQSKWAGQVGRRAVRLAEMMRTGLDVPHR